MWAAAGRFFHHFISSTMKNSIVPAIGQTNTQQITVTRQEAALLEYLTDGSAADIVKKARGIVKFQQIIFVSQAKQDRGVSPDEWAGLVATNFIVAQMLEIAEARETVKN